MAAVTLWPAEGLTVLDANGDTITTGGIIVPTFTTYYRDLVRSGHLLTFDPLELDAEPVTVGPSEIAVYLSTQLAANPGVVDGQVAIISGRSAVNDGAEGLAVWDDDSNVTPDNATVWGTGPGQWLRLLNGNSYDVRWFGARTDLTVASATNLITANTAAIQACIDAVVAAPSKGKVRLPAGTYVTNSTLHLYRNGTFSSVVLEGDGYRYGSDWSFCGTAIIATHSDSPAINVQGARGSVVRGIALKGPLYDWIADNALANTDVNLLDDVDPDNWLDPDPSYSANADSRYAPHAGIAIDGWSGSAPATHYPTTFVSYGQGASSDVLIEDCEIRGFAAAIVNKPADSISNADFTLIRRANIAYCKWGISVGNTQSRQVGIQDVKMGFVHTCLTNNTHGGQQGKFSGTVDNLSVSCVINIFKFGSSAYFGPIKFVCCYGEAVYRLGDIASSALAETSISFDECQWSLSNQNEERGIPANVLDCGSVPINVSFSGGTFGNFKSVVPIMANGVTANGITITSDTRDATVSKAYLAHFNNGTAGGLILPSFDNAQSNRIKFGQSDLSLGTFDVAPVWAEAGMRKSDRNRCIPAWVQSVSPSSGELFAYRRKNNPGIVALTSLTSVTLTHVTGGGAATPGILTLVFSALTDATAENYGMCPGDAILHDATGMTFAIRSRTGTTVIAEAQNNYQLTAGAYSTVTAFDNTAGNFYFLNCRMYTPTYAILADLTAGSAVLANAGRGDGYAGFLESDIAVGDRVVQSEHGRNWVDYTNNAVSARSNAGLTITLAGNVNTGYSQTRVPVELFIRTPPANEASR